MGDGHLTAPLLRSDRLKAIVFDLDGTLYQDERLGREVNLSACRYLASLKGITEAEADALLKQARAASEAEGTLSRAVQALGGNLQDLHQRMSQEVHPEGVLELDPRVPELLKLLAARFELHVYTNNNRQLSERIMAQIGVSGLFRKTFTIEDHWLHKPDQAVLLRILQAIGQEPDQTLFVGDRFQVDLALPHALGCAIFEAKTVEELLGLAELVR